MMKSLAPDHIWLKVAWQGSEHKISFSKVLCAFFTAIKKVSRETFDECNAKHCETKVKSFLRHTEERVKRAEAKSSKLEATS